MVRKVPNYESEISFLPKPITWSQGVTIIPRIFINIQEFIINYGLGVRKLK